MTASTITLENEKPPVLIALAFFLFQLSCHYQMTLKFHYYPYLNGLQHRRFTKRQMIHMKHLLTAVFTLFAFCAISQTDPMRTDWANLKRYADQNKNLSMISNQHRVVFMGNSITEGWSNFDSAFFVGKPYINRGIGGQTTPQMLIRFRPDVLELKPNVVVILAGINDIAENTGPISLEAVFGNIVSMVELARANRIKVVVSSVLPANVFPWRKEIYPADKVIALNAMLRKYCTQHNVIYLDYYTPMVDDAKGLKQAYTYDGVHPNLVGYKIMETLVEEAIRKAMKKKR